jgi:phosphatidylserine/phosphatidylglycerophosphate/cardiolipin synthase-like enzyme
MDTPYSSAAAWGVGRTNFENGGNRQSGRYQKCKKMMIIRKVTALVLLLLSSAVPVFAQQDSSSVEWLKVYFDMPSDHSAALPGNKNRDKQDLIGTLQTLIDSAQSSIDLCIFDLENPRISKALVKAKKRGVQIRIVTDNDNRDNSPNLDSLMWSQLGKSGIMSIDDDGDIYMPDGSIHDHSLTGHSYYMHDKFAVIDYGDENPNNDYVWTGSTNLTYTAEYNTNNVVIIKDHEVARTYTNEFNQMWGSNTTTPDPSKARFHKDKKPHKQHTFFVGKTRVEIYFSPENRGHNKPNIAKRLVKLIDQRANQEVDFLSFAMSPSYPMSQTLWQLSAKGKIKLQGVIDHLFYAIYKHKGVMWASAGATRGNRMILGSNELRKLHDKVAIIDGQNPTSPGEGIVITGSYNFSKSANRDNDENLLIIYSNKIANQYYQAFQGVMNRAQGKTRPPSPPISTKRWYPVKHKIEDGSRFKIDVVPGFEYPVRLLGVEIPRVYAGTDSSDYYAQKTRRYMQNLLQGASVQLSGPHGSKPEAKHGSFHAYVIVHKDGKTFSLNQKVLKDGMGRYVPYYAQNPDSVTAFKCYQSTAMRAKRGLWKYPDSIYKKIPRP